MGCVPPQVRKTHCIDDAKSLLCSGHGACTRAPTVFRIRPNSGEFGYFCWEIATSKRASLDMRQNLPQAAEEKNGREIL
jgi:hypothetical protein